MSAPSGRTPQFSIPCILFPPLHWWAAALRAAGTPVPLFTGLPHNGATAPNRYTIATANGVQTLPVPISGGRRQRLPVNELRIDYMHDWQRQHWGALYSAYGRAPYFAHYTSGLEQLIQTRYERLAEFSKASMEWLNSEMRLGLRFTETMDTAYSEQSQFDLPPYHQVFEDRWGFLRNLSAIDLLMNEGPYAADYLQG